MSKRLLDLLLASLGLVAASPLILIAMLLVWSGDGRSPFYLAPRVGRHGRDFRMVKLRTMRVGADSNGVSSTGRSDTRVTSVGRFLRQWKLDELPQLWNVLAGEMSLVGPRPNLRAGAALYTAAERRLLDARPGMTDLASIVFSDEADILDGAADPDALYDAVIRPWKSRLGLLYVDNATFADDLEIIALTLLAFIARPLALRGVGAMLDAWGANEELRRICGRHAPLERGEPPALPL